MMMKPLAIAHMNWDDEALQQATELLEKYAINDNVKKQTKLTQDAIDLYNDLQTARTEHHLGNISDEEYSFRMAGWTDRVIKNLVEAYPDVIKMERKDG